MDTDATAGWFGAGFGALAFASLMAAVVVHLPPSDRSLAANRPWKRFFGSTPRIVVASIVAFLCGTFINSYVLAKMKIWTEGRWLWTRIVGSTLCGGTGRLGDFLQPRLLRPHAAPRTSSPSCSRSMR